MNNNMPIIRSRKWLNLFATVSLILKSTSIQPIGAAETNASHWREFRNGGSSIAAMQLPTHWSSTKGIRWQRELAGYGQSAPIVSGRRVFVTSVEGNLKDTCIVQCLDLDTGNLIWRHTLPASDKSPSNFRAARSAPTPVVDASGVIAFFETGDVVAIDQAGKQRWHRSLTADYGKFDNNHGLGTSPTQNDTHVYLNIQHRGPSYLVAIDKRVGGTAWKVDRASTSSWSSPIIISNQGADAVVISSSGSVDAFHANTGKRLWSIDGLEGNSVPSPTFVNNRLFIGARQPEFGSVSEAAQSNMCIDLAEWQSGAGTPSVAWRATKAMSDYASPVVAENCVYFLTKSGILHCLDSRTGGTHYSERLRTQCWATPIVNGEHVYFFGKDGKTQVLKAGPKFEIVASNELWNSDSPPKPENYVEYSGGHGHGEHGAGGTGAAGKGRSGKGGPGGGILALLSRSDSDGDGRLTESELPAEFRPMLKRIDTNGDGVVDQSEIQAMAASFAARRADSREDTRDPIVYGAAAADNCIVVRTGTRVYCIH